LHARTVRYRATCLTHPRRLGDLQLAVSDILGGNSFQICLFVLANALAGTPVIFAAHKSDVWLGRMGLLITGLRMPRSLPGRNAHSFWLGVDSIAPAVVYALALGALPSITS